MTLPSLTGLRIRQLEAERDELTAALGQAREIAAALEEQNAALIGDWTDLLSRLERAQDAVNALAGSSAMDGARLRGKAQGIALGLDYMRGYPDRTAQ